MGWEQRFGALLPPHPLCFTPESLFSVFSNWKEDSENKDAMGHFSIYSLNWNFCIVHSCSSRRFSWIFTDIAADFVLTNQHIQDNLQKALSGCNNTARSKCDIGKKHDVGVWFWGNVWDERHYFLLTKVTELPCVILGINRCFHDYKLSSVLDV